jgi:hypothetical protein
MQKRCFLFLFLFYSLLSGGLFGMDYASETISYKEREEEEQEIYKKIEDYLKAQRSNEEIQKSFGYSSADQDRILKNTGHYPFAKAAIGIAAYLLKGFAAANLTKIRSIRTIINDYIKKTLKDHLHLNELNDKIYYLIFDRALTIQICSRKPFDDVIWKDYERAFFSHLSRFEKQLVSRELKSFERPKE